jgi:tetratricopeptide (TPR) repeat protein
MDRKGAQSEHATSHRGQHFGMTERRPDADRFQAVGVNVFELRAGIRARGAVPPSPGLLLRIGRGARLAISSSREFFARKRPALRTSKERIVRLYLALVGAVGRRVRHHEIPNAPSAEATPEVLDVDRDDPALRQALLRLATREDAFGANHPNVASELHFIGALHHEGGRYDEALAYYGQALAIRERTLSPDHPELASTLEDLAATRQAQGEAAEAEQLLTRAQRLRIRYRSPLLDKTDIEPQFARENPGEAFDLAP